ncbi:unnamed protein product [Nippostrongylus brasiliensis]|uniref:Innexin n=1 Tax=Nippostrongylus brasiliensis TaxID=27835 RepID=A0A0N4XFH4_NIPBR|nr:unnamed protein product [Nippostrongylus brasiliensis]
MSISVRFLETDKYSWYGLGAMVDLLNGTTWQQSGMFPRVSLCDFDVRVMGNVQEHTVQCVLVINIFNEKIFIFLWFWYLMLVIFTLGSFLYWLFVALIPQPNRRFIKRHLEISEMPFDPVENDRDVRRFIDNYLRSDGVFVIRMLTLQSGVIFGTDLVVSLWKSFFGIEEKLKRSDSMPHIKEASDENTRYWPPPPEPLDDHEIRMRKALGQNIDNSVISQDVLQNYFRTNPNNSRAPRYVAAVSAPTAESENSSEALIRSLENSPKKHVFTPKLDKK